MNTVNKEDAAFVSNQVSSRKILLAGIVSG
jgi:hypothetical protein